MAEKWTLINPKLPDPNWTVHDRDTGITLSVYGEGNAAKLLHILKEGLVTAEQGGLDTPANTESLEREIIEITASPPEEIEEPEWTCQCGASNKGRITCRSCGEMLRTKEEQVHVS